MKGVVYLEREKRLYMFVYRLLLTSIYNGTYKFEEKLPSLPDLCKQYQVGRNTIRSALAQLQIDGYVLLQKGIQASVSFNIEEFNTNEKYRQLLIDTRAMTQDVYETMYYILPDLFVACYHYKAMDEKAYNEVLNTFTMEYIHDETQLIRTMYKLYLFVFRQMDNPLLIDLFFSLMSYAYQPLTPEVQTYEKLKRSVQGIHRAATILGKLIHAKQDKLVKNMISIFIKLHNKNSLKYIDKVCDGLEVENPAEFVWVCNRTHEYLYAIVVLDIITEIAKGNFQKDSILPSISQMSEIYEVSERTTRKALQVLRDYQIVETINGVGSKIMRVHFESDHEILKDIEVQENLKAYYETLQIFTVMMNSVMMKVLKHISNEALKEVAIQMEQMSLYKLEIFAECLFSQTNACLHTIFYEMRKTLNWSVFTNMFVNDALDRHLREELMKELYAGNRHKICKIVLQILANDEKLVLSLLRK